LVDIVVGAILVGVLAVVLLFYYLSERDKRAVRRARKRRFSPQWTKRPGETTRRKRQ
jgi:hypothetical protein